MYHRWYTPAVNDIQRVPPEVRDIANTLKYVKKEDDELRKCMEIMIKMKNAIAKQKEKMFQAQAHDNKRHTTRKGW